MTLELEPSPPAAGDRWRDGEYDLIYEFLAALAGSPADGETVVQRGSGGFTHWLPQTLGATAAATGGLLPPAIPGHSHRVSPAFDPNRARSLLSEARHPDGRGLGEIVLTHFGIQRRWHPPSPPSSRV